MTTRDQDDIWKDDFLGRKDDGTYLQRFIENAYKMDSGHQTSFVLNINSEWGSGKTWFLERLSKQLNVNHPVVYFDAWKNDFTKDPLMSFVAVVCESLEKQFSTDSTTKGKVDSVKKAALKFIKPSLPVVLAALAKHYTGVNFLEAADDSDDDSTIGDEQSTMQDAASSLTKIAASEAMNSFYEQKRGIEEFVNAIKDFVAHLRSVNSNSYLPICILIDELDRCRPTFAIELLETVKHIFSIGGLFFIVATDSTQLAHSINAVYGEKFDSGTYLKRFFYTEYTLSNVDYNKMAKHLISGFDFKDKVYLPSAYLNALGLDGYFSINSKFFLLTPREQEQVFVNLKNCILSSDFDVIHFAYLLFLLSVKIKHENIYNEMMINPDSDKFTSFMNLRRGGTIGMSIASEHKERVIQKPSTPKTLDVAVIVDTYSSMSNKNYAELIKREHKYHFQEEILDKFRIEATGGHQLGGDVVSTSQYFLLIDHAGRLVKKI